MTAKEVVVGVDDSPSARAALRWAAEYARSTGAVLRGIHVVDWPEAHDMYTYPVVADYIYPDTSQVEDAYRQPNIGFSRRYIRSPTGPCGSPRDTPGESW